jgi:hypothetical protein
MSQDDDAIVRALTDARWFLEQGWCKWAQGRTAHGREVEGRDPEAVQWCLYGAIMKATPPGTGRMSSDLEIAVAEQIGEMLPPEYYKTHFAAFNNDQLTVEPVLAVIDAAIANRNERMALDKIS